MCKDDMLSCPLQLRPTASGLLNDPRAGENKKVAQIPSGNNGDLGHTAKRTQNIYKHTQSFV